LYLEGKYTVDKRFWPIQSEIKNLMDKKTFPIGDKWELYKVLDAKFPEAAMNFMMKSQFVNIDVVNGFNQSKAIKEMFKYKGPLILKPISGMQGLGIMLFNNFDDLRYYIRDYTRNHRDSVTERGWTLQEYITNPYLYEGKKCHMRVYFLVVYDEALQKMRGYVFKWAPVHTAKKPFVLDDWNNRDIHDTHFQESFVKDFPKDTYSVFSEDQVPIMWDRIYTLFKYILQLVTTSGCYPENKRCYHIFGADIMITQDLMPKLLEINTYPGFCNLPECQEFIKDYLESQFELTIDKWYPPTHPQPLNNGFVEITDYVSEYQIGGQKGNILTISGGITPNISSTRPNICVLVHNIDFVWTIFFKNYNLQLCDL
jgi:hypothetical protein